MGMNTEFQKLFELGRSERLQLVEDLWDSLVKEEADLPVEEWKLEELLRRKEYVRQNPDSVLSWEEVKRRVRSRHA